MNNLDPEVAEHPEDLVVYGGTGKAARSWEAYDAIVRTLDELEPDETLLVQSGKPVGVFRTHEWAPRVLIANSNLVGDWANWPEFRRLEELGLIMYGQMTAGSWIYIGTQGILQGTYETFAAVARSLGRDSLRGTLTLTGGAGGMGGAQPLAVTMNDGTVLIVDVDESRLARRVDHGYLDEYTTDLDAAVARVVAVKEAGEALSVGVVGNAAEVFPELRRRGVPIDIVTDQTSAHDPLAYLRSGSASRSGRPKPSATPRSSLAGRANPWRHMSRRWSRSRRGSCRVRLRQLDQSRGAARWLRPGLRLPRIRARLHPSAVRRGARPVPLGGSLRRPRGHLQDRSRHRRTLPEDAALHRWLEKAAEKVHFEGLPARICWLGYKERHLAGLKFNEMVASGELSAPIVIGRDHLDSGSVASPYRETEAMKDGSDAIADWPLLNALLNTASGASWVSLHHGGGVGIGRSIHAGQVTVADGSALAAEKLERVLTNDPGTGCDAPRGCRV